MKRLILDTQCLLSAVSGYHQHKSTSLAAIWAAFRRRELILVFSEVSLTEIQRVLDYASVRQLNITSGQAFAAASQLLLLGEYHAPVPTYSWPSLTDEKDWFLLDLLYHSEADALISRDKRVLQAGVALGLPIRKP